MTYANFDKYINDILLNISKKNHSYKNEMTLFLIVFVLVFSTTKLSGFASIGNVEQWVNITNQTFYGSQDFLFSYGPLYWLTGGVTQSYNGLTYWAAVVFICLSNSFFWTLILDLIHRTKNYLLFTVAFVIFLKTIALTATFFMWPFALISYFEFSKNETLKSSKFIIILSGIFVAFALYVRFFYGLVGLLTIGSYLFSRFLVGRKISSPIYFGVSILIAYFVLGMMIFHDYASVVNYIKINSQLSFGNSVDMTLDVNNTSESIIYAFLVLLFLNVFIIVKRRWSLLISINISWLLLFKLGFSRTDHYLGYFVLPVAILTFTMLFDKGRIGKLLFIASIVSLYLLASKPTYPGARTINLFNKPVAFDSDYFTRMEKVYSKYKLKNNILGVVGDSKLDVYPYNNEYAFANKLNYWYRPSFQNYMTLTPKLDQMNSDFYNGIDKPEFILWTSGLVCHGINCNPFNGFDKKYSLNEDPLTSEAILYNYHPVLLSSGKDNIPVMLFKKNSVTIDKKETILLDSEVEFGKWYDVPKSSGVVKVKPELKFTLLGRLKNMLFRGGILKIKYQLDTGDVKTYRLNILNSVSGIWVSPLPNKFSEQGIIGDNVVAIMFETEEKNYFPDRFIARFIDLNIPNIYKGKLIKNEISSPPTINASMVCPRAIDSISINGNVFRDRPVMVASKAMVINGWMAFSANTGTLFDETMMTLTDKNGQKSFFTTEIQQRNDVSHYFKNSSLSSSGFKTAINLSRFSGDYTLGLAGIHNEKLLDCENFRIPIIIN